MEDNTYFNLQDEVDSILHVTGGYYDFLEPKYIYINRKMDKQLTREVELHEAFHRYISTSTIYGWIVSLQTHALSQIQELEKPELVASINESRNRMFREMYIVQEGGAISRTLFNLSRIYGSPSTAEEFFDREKTFVERLTKPYRKIAYIYCSSIRHLLGDYFEYIPTVLASYISETIAHFAMNSVHLSDPKSLNSLASQSEVFFEKISPDRRLYLILQELLKPENREFFAVSLTQEIENEFNVKKIREYGKEEELVSCMIKNPDDAEFLITKSICASLQKIMPDFSVPVWSDKYADCLKGWKRSIDEPIARKHAGYSQYKVHFMSTQKEKESFFDEYKKEF